MNTGPKPSVRPHGRLGGSQFDSDADVVTAA